MTDSLSELRHDILAIASTHAHPIGIVDRGD